MDEPAVIARFLLIVATLLTVSALLSRAAARTGIPVILIFLVIGMVAGSEGLGGLAFEDYRLSFHLGTVALVLILFDGGLHTDIRAARRVLAPSVLLASVGVAATAALLAVGARLLGLPWGDALLLGAVVSSTDAAAVFAVLRGARLELRRRTALTLELESGLNDPLAVILTLSLTHARLGETDLTRALTLGLAGQLAVGAAAGVLVAIGGRSLLERAQLLTRGLYPILTVALAFVAFGAATLAHGSGFLAVFVAGMTLSHRPLPYEADVHRVHDTLAWLSQILMFVLLGLLVFPSRLAGIAGTGLAVALVLALVARPAAVALCLLPFRYRPREIAFIGLVGLRGSVPIILATYPVLAGVPGGARIFDLVFFVVVLSALTTGTTLRPLTRWLGQHRPRAPQPRSQLELSAPTPLAQRLTSFCVSEASAVAGASVADVVLPDGAAIILVTRHNQVLAVHPELVLQPGDHVHVLYEPSSEGQVLLLFGLPEPPHD